LRLSNTRKKALAIYRKPAPHGLLGIGIFMKNKEIEREKSFEG
jgi:hypothetical protein